MFSLFKSRLAGIDEAGDVEDSVSPEDEAATNYIQQKSQIGTMFAERLSDPDEDYAKQRSHYENIRDELLISLDTIDDEFCRGFSSHCLVEMCVAANDLAVAKALLCGVRDEFI